ncbi:MAG: four helix bundle protein [Neisseriaceae bacterium]|nr:four helix bundle protein [Neisseriaceae bacterium]MBQ9683826.1 four helix bundle protein [Neisseriaceae bacterium]MBQ9725418.1 four helix bundle protein [Neisseriaceae bacterium]
MKHSITKDKSKAFALRIIRLYQFLIDEKHEFVLSKQVLRSGTSIGANITEALCSISRKEFSAKMYIAFKECAETKYWLELLFEANIITEPQFISLSKDCEELYKMLSSITKTLKTTPNS